MVVNDGGGTGTVGYNPQEVDLVLKQINDEWEKIVLIADDMYQTKVISEIAATWFAPEAQQACQKIVENENSFLKNACIYFNHNNIKINDAAQKWADTVYAVHAVIPLSPVVNGCSKVDASIVQASNNGFVGISDISRLEQVVNNLEVIEKEIEEHSDKIYNIYTQHPAFIGADQMLELSRGYATLIGEHLYLTMAENKNMIKKVINETKEKYMQTAQANAQRFSSGN